MQAICKYTVSKVQVSNEFNEEFSTQINVHKGSIPVAKFVEV